eukprot:SAG31_NODE_24537_length_479_cov_0.952632_1_plen_79_part_10
MKAVLDNITKLFVQLERRTQGVYGGKELAELQLAVSSPLVQCQRGLFDPECGGNVEQIQHQMVTKVFAVLRHRSDSPGF